jgi:hypothetical protein
MNNPFALFKGAIHLAPEIWVAHLDGIDEMKSAISAKDLNEVGALAISISRCAFGIDSDWAVARFHSFDGCEEALAVND